MGLGSTGYRSFRWPRVCGSSFDSATPCDQLARALRGQTCDLTLSSNALVIFRHWKVFSYVSKSDGPSQRNSNMFNNGSRSMISLEDELLEAVRDLELERDLIDFKEAERQATENLNGKVALLDEEVTSPPNSSFKRELRRSWWSSASIEVHLSTTSDSERSQKGTNSAKSCSSRYVRKPSVLSGRILTTTDCCLSSSSSRGSFACLNKSCWCGVFQRINSWSRKSYQTA